MWWRRPLALAGFLAAVIAAYAAGLLRLFGGPDFWVPRYAVIVLTATLLVGCTTSCPCLYGREPVTIKMQCAALAVPEGDVR